MLEDASGKCERRANERRRAACVASGRFATTARVRRWQLFAVALALSVSPAGASLAAEWNPTAFAKEDTLKLRTVGPEEGAYAFPVWLVVLDGQVYVRLGARAANRVQRNTTAPYVGVEVAGQRFDRVRGVPAPEYAERVSKAMAEKYTSDILMRWFSHPLTLRLVPE